MNVDSRHDPESLLDDTDYQHIVHTDSLLCRTGSNNFSSLIETPSHSISVDEGLSQLENHIPPTHQPQFPQDIYAIVNSAMAVENGSVLPSHEVPLQETETWANMEDLLDIPHESTIDEQYEASLWPAEGNNAATTTTTTTVVPDTTPRSKVPSLQVWPGEYDFTLSLPVGNKEKKWCYSSVQNKLYLDRFITVPIHVNLTQWIDASITITPVFKDSNHRVDTVIPCFLCKKKVDNNDLENHMVLVEGQECAYQQVDDRYVVTVPLHPPPLGEVSSILLLKLSCLTSHSGGPNRRPFCIVFTLHNSSGDLIGRQVLDVKGCKCPSRDMLNEEDKDALKRQHHAHSSGNSHPLDSARTLKRPAAPVTATGSKKKKRVNIKPEPGTEEYGLYKLPVRFIDRVRAYIKHLRIEEYIEKHDPNVLTGPEDEF